jgi:hypothetical protein
LKGNDDLAALEKELEALESDEDDRV